MELLWIITIFCVMYAVVVFLCLHYVQIINRERDEWKNLACTATEEMNSIEKEMERIRQDLNNLTYMRTNCDA